MVGIAYHTDEDRLRALVEWSVWRRRDFTPEPEPAADSSWQDRLVGLGGNADLEVRSGGAAAFLEFLQRKVIPFVEANYHVSRSDRSLAAYSLGGLFTLYALFQAPETFHRFLVGDPSMRESVFEQEGFAAARGDLSGDLYLVTAGPDETVDRLVERLRSREYPGLVVQHDVLRDEDHISAGPAAISRMLHRVHFHR